MLGMKCPACGYEQLGEFPQFNVRGFATQSFERHAVDLAKIPDDPTGNRIATLHMCPKCGTLRIRIKQLR